MRSINASIVAELQAETLRPFLLSDLTIDSEHYRYTDCDVPITFDSNIYSPRGFRVPGIQYSMVKVVDQAVIEFDNLDEVFTALFVGSSVQGEDYALYQVVLDADYSIVVDEAITRFSGTIDSWELNEQRLLLTVTSPLATWSQKTLRFHSSNCGWKAFEGTECTYSGGETWCDRTHVRCQALSNQANFGGFRWLPSIVGKDVWWGRSPKYGT